MYIKYLIFSICQLLCMALCYLTNPLVVLFADRQGELPKVLRLWQTWDSSLDNRQYVLYDCPRWLSYDFDDYYECSAIPIGYGRYKKAVRLKKPSPAVCGSSAILIVSFGFTAIVAMGLRSTCLAWTRTRRLSAGKVSTLLFRPTLSAIKTMTISANIGVGASIWVGSLIFTTPAGP